ncbi:MAG: hypothetical protein ACI845_003506 [Gammaproteobacteria bacterium]|jgi:hypothetical protein
MRSDPLQGQAVLDYLSRYTHRVAIANSRLLTLDERGVTFKWKDYRNKGQSRFKAMRLKTDEFIRRFLIHLLHSGFHHIRHYGLLANARRAENFKRARALLIDQADVKDNEKVVSENTKPSQDEVAEQSEQPQPTYTDCGNPMAIIERFECGQLPRAPPTKTIAA